MARVSDEMLREVHRELTQFKQASGHQSAYAAAHLAGAVEALLEEAESDERPDSGQQDSALRSLPEPT